MTRFLARPVALFTALVVGWTALWPLVAAAHASLTGEEVRLCHQAGSMVAPGEMPTGSSPGNQGKTHCPLCIMAFYGSAAPAIAIPPLEFSTLSVRLETYSAPLPRSSQQVSLPPSRAPPVLS